MNPKPFLFISHSAKEKPADALLEKLRKGLENLGWYVFVDRTRLQPGALWREQLHSALAVCDAAVILFSRAAYEDSQWVLKEATIFDWRTALNRKDPFPIVPVLFPEVTRTDLCKGRFTALTLGERLPVDAGAPDVVEQVNKALGKPKTGRSPLETFQHAIAVLLKHVDAADLRYASRHLGETLDWDTELDPHERFARDLFHAELPAVRQTLEDIAIYLNTRQILEIIDLLLPFTVDAIAVAPIPAVALKPLPCDRTVLAINTHSENTGHRYIHRARCHPLPWMVYTLTNSGGNDPAGSLIDELYREIRTYAGKEQISEKKIQEQLKTELEEGSPSFVLVHGSPEKQVVDRLRETFPSCTFLVLAGDDARDEARLKAANVELLTPRLEPQREAWLEQQIEMARKIAMRRQSVGRR